ncbi:CBS domain-containing protein [Streptomyces sp. WI04-05B]|uniref:CBS domain-containing protein n=1 Tax=Streptomyces TaxID=1883 RepID=UPI0029B13F57|nr:MULTISPECIES: CBS domain-containing protein [unclassified Streptomyces]MDX2548854.1 CBS domain-containing protein [Streptomyces sp. WI04-05B]MDX2587633.1 CBS domain-containing protein [Streptomyces sp. WI04-05A]
MTEEHTVKIHTVGDVMTDEVVQAHRETPFKDVVRLLDAHRISGLPVVDHDDKVIGVVSGTDLVRGQAARAGGRRDRSYRLPRLRRPGHRAAPGALASTAGELMSTPAITVHPEQPVPDAARMMERHGIERLPVVDEEDRLIGIATRRDLLRVFLRTDEDIRRQVTDEILGAAPGLPPDAVVVSVRDGLVTLEGRLEHRTDIAHAVRSTWQVGGVVGVFSGLTFRLDGDRPAEKGPSRGITGH